VQVDAVDLAASRRRSDDVDHDWSFIQEAEEGSGAAVGDHRSLAAGKSSSHETAAVVPARVPDCVDAAEDAVEAADLDRVVDHVVADPEVTHLSA